MKTKVPILQAQDPREFVYRGSAVAAGGFLTRVGTEPIETDGRTVTTHGESCLPMIGGLSHSVVEPKLAFGKNIQYGTCETFVWGRRVGDSTVTTLSASVVKVLLSNTPSPDDRVPDVRSITFEAARIALEVESTHPQDRQPFFVLKKAEAVGMVLVTTRSSGEIIRTPIELVPNRTFISLTTMKDLDNAFLTNRKFFDQQVALLPTKTAPVFGAATAPRTEHGYYSGSFVQSIKFGNKTIKGNVLTVKGFGTFSFGRLITDSISRRVSMVGVKMGSETGADVSFSGVETNGIWM